MSNQKDNVVERKRLYQQWQFWVMILVVIGVICLVLINSINPEPHFKITKEECWNETNENHKLICDNGCSYSWLFHKNKTIWNLCNGFCENMHTELKCEPKEVDEIKLEKANSMIFNTCLKEQVGKFDNDSERWVFCYEKSFEISKQDLSIEWLDENCECVEAKYPKECNTGVQNKDIVLKEGSLFKRIFNIGEYAGYEICEKSCQKYKYNEYTIEVWNQIK